MRNTKKAFTLVELIVVITILAILATVAFVSLGGQTDNAKNTIKKDNLAKLTTSIENARVNTVMLSAFVDPN
jgi:prepilin-type N-terminal cleavage/methylation domain-containing protein